MRKNIKLILALVAITLIFTGGNCYKKMLKTPEKIVPNCSSPILSLKGDSITASFTVAFPAKYFHKKIKLEVTPVLKAIDGSYEVAGAVKYIQGEKVKDNFIAIPFKAGGSYSQKVVFKFDPRLRQSVLELRVRSVCGKESFEDPKYAAKIYTFPMTFKVADGVSMVQTYLDKTPKMEVLANNFQRVTQADKSAELFFLVGKSDVRKSETSLAEFKALDSFVVSALQDPKKTIKAVSLLGYASPEGSVDLNDKLSKARGENTKQVLADKAKSSKKAETADIPFNLASEGEDWKGFQEAVRASSIKDKELIIKVLEMYSDPNQRETEIRKMASIYSSLKNEILPKQRRSKTTVNIDVEGFTDAEFLELVKNNNLDQLTVEELLFCATLIDEPTIKAKVLTKAAAQYNDFRAFNNAGVTYFETGNATDAKTNIKKAAELNTSSNEIKNNMGAVALIDEDLKGASDLLLPLSSQSAKYNMGIIYIQAGKYSEAVGNLGESKSYNFALAKTLDGDLPTAKQTVDPLATAKAAYLKAILAARESQEDALYTNLAKAIELDSNLKGLAATEVEFIKYSKSDKFVALTK